MRTPILPVLLLTACSSILVPAAGNKKDGYFHNPSPFWNQSGGGDDDTGTTVTTGITDDTGTFTTGTTDTSGTTATGDCPFGDSSSLTSTFTVTDDGCGFSQSSFSGDESFQCEGGGHFTLTDSGFVSSSMDCTLSGLDFSCSLESSYVFTLTGTFKSDGTRATGNWNLDEGSCADSGTFTWK